MLLHSQDCSTLLLIHTLYCWVLSKDASCTIFCVFGMTQPGDWTQVSWAIYKHSNHHGNVEFTFYFVLMLFEKAWIHLSSLQLYVNSRADWVLQSWLGNQSWIRKTLNSNHDYSTLKLTLCCILPIEESLNKYTLLLFNAF